MKAQTPEARGFLTLQIPPALMQRLEDHLEKLRGTFPEISRSALVRQLLTQGLDAAERPKRRNPA
jgi:hypothetical protein